MKIVWLLRISLWSSFSLNFVNILVNCLLLIQEQRRRVGLDVEEIVVILIVVVWRSVGEGDRVRVWGWVLFMGAMIGDYNNKFISYNYLHIS